MTSQALSVEAMAAAVEPPGADASNMPASPGKVRLEKLLARSRNSQRPATRRLRIVTRLGKPVNAPSAHPVGDDGPPIAPPDWESSDLPGGTAVVQEWLEQGQPPEDIGFRSLAAAAGTHSAAPTVESVEKLALRLPEVMSDALAQLESANEKRTEELIGRATQQFDGRMAVLESTLDRLSERVDHVAANRSEETAVPAGTPPPEVELGALRTEMTLKLLTLVFAAAALVSLAIIFRGLAG